MKLTLLFSFLLFLSSWGTILSQTTKLSLNLKNVPVQELILQIEDQTEFYFLYQDEVFRKDQKITIQANDASVESILQQMAEQAFVQYKIIDRQIVLLPAESKTAPAVIKGKTETQQPQKKEIKGSVKDGNGIPLPGVSVVVKGTTTGTITDGNGQFNLSVPENAATLLFSFIGMKTMEAPIGNNLAVNVTMEEETVGVEEVVVVGYGQQAKVSVTGAITSVDAREMLKSPTSSVQNALTGRAPGIITVQRSGAPGDDYSEIYIRGRATTGNSSPLILVDGIERDITTLDPNEIESLNVLKDASATAVFGVRGANGVIVVTTKTGTAGAKPVFSFTANYGLASPTRVPRFLNSVEFAKFQNMAFRNDVRSSANPEGPATFTPPFSDADIALYESGADPIFHPNIDWMSTLLRDNVPQQNYNLNISGGTEKAKYFVSLGYMSQEGVLGGLQVFDDIPINGKQDRYNIRANTDFQWTKNFSTAIKFSTQVTKGINTDVVVAANASDGVGSNVLHAVFAANPLSVIPLYDGKIISAVPELARFGGSNPYTLYSKSYTIEYEARTTLDISGVYKLDDITKGLSVRGKFAYDNYYRQYATRNRDIDEYEIRRTAPGYEGDYFTVVQTKFAGAFTGDERYTSNYRLYSEGSVNYSRSFSGGHTVNGLFLGTMERIYKGGSPALPYNYMGLVGRATYDYKKKYLGEFNMGYNGSENFAKGKQFGFFPSFSLGYVVTEEEFFPKNEIVTFLKIRGSHGKVGNDKIGGNRFLYTPSSFNITTYAANALNTIRFGDANTINSGTYDESKIGNPDISWEVATKSNIGIELKMFDNSLSLSGDLFKENREGILGSYNNVPFTFGDLSLLPSYNLGIVENQGYEIEAGYRSSNKKSFQFWFNANYTFARNKIVFNDEVTPAYPNLVRTGKPIGQPFMLLSDGLYNTWDEINDPARVKTKWDLNVQPGDLRYIDITGDNFIDENDQTAVGYGTIPEIIYGITTGMSWKNFDMSVLFQGTEHVSNYLATPFYSAIAYTARVENAYNTWTKEKYEAGETITEPRISVASGGANYQVNSFLNIDASYFRIKNLEVGYTFSKTFAKKISCSMLRISFSGQNLATFSKMKYFDPETSKNTDRTYPVMRVLNLGLKANF